MSGDADFEPVVRRVRDLGKKVYIAFFPYAIAVALREASDGLMPTAFHAQTLAHKFLATLITNGFRREFLSSIGELVEELETKNYFKPILRLRNSRGFIEAIKKGI